MLSDSLTHKNSLRRCSPSYFVSMSVWRNLVKTTRRFDQDVWVFTLWVILTGAGDGCIVNGKQRCVVFTAAIQKWFKAQFQKHQPAAHHSIHMLLLLSLSNVSHILRICITEQRESDNEAFVW